MLPCCNELKSEVERVDIAKHQRTRRRRLLCIIGLLAPLALLLGTRTASAQVNASGDGSPSPIRSLADQSASAFDTPTSAAGGEFNNVGCYGTALCVAVGKGGNGIGLIEVSSDGGMNFVDEPVPGDTPPLLGVTCITALRCFAVGNTNQAMSMVLLTNDGGNTWVGQTVGQGLISVACGSPSFCVAAGFYNTPPSGTLGDIFSTSDGGTTWTSASPPSPAPYFFPGGKVGCLSTTECVVGSESIYLTNDAGSTWQSPVSALGSISSIACPTASDCVATEPGVEWESNPSAQGNVLVTGDGGSSWNLVSTPPYTNSVSWISCGSATTCYIVGQPWTSSDLEVVAVTHDDGATWSTLTGPGGFLYQGPVDSSFGFGAGAPSPDSLIIVGRDGSGPRVWLTADGGSTWIDGNVDDGPPVGTPEAPTAIALPIAGTLIAGGTFWFLRRRRSPI